MSACVGFTRRLASGADARRIQARVDTAMLDARDTKAWGDASHPLSGCCLTTVRRQDVADMWRIVLRERELAVVPISLLPRREP